MLCERWWKPGIAFLVVMFLAACASTPATPPEATDPEAEEVPTERPATTDEAQETVIETPTPVTDTPLSDEQQLSNLVAFGRLYGLVRYFHPSDGVAEMRSWSRVATNGVRTVHDARTPAELAARLESYFAPIAPTVQVYVQADGEPPALVDRPDSEGPLNIVMWEHVGVGADFRRGPGSDVYHSERVEARWDGSQIPEGFVDPTAGDTADLGGGLAVRVPLALYADGEGTFPRISADTDLMDQSWPLPENARHLASIIMYWNVMRHFYPYLDVQDGDWDAALAEALTRTLEADDDAEREEALLWLMAESNDGHATLLESTEYSLRVPLLNVDWLEGQLVILADRRDVDDLLPPGTVIVSIDGEDAQTRFATLMAGAPGATAQFREVRALQRILLGPDGSEATLAIRRPDGSEETVAAERVEWAGMLDAGPTRPERIAELEPGIYYVDLTRVENPHLNAALPDLETAQGIIFDVRGYPTGAALTVLPHLYAEPMSTAPFLIPRTRLPYQQEVEWEDMSWSLPHEKPQLTENIVFLTDGNAISYAETVMGIVDHYDLGEIVGRPTAGTNGNINRLDLPTGHSALWTGMRVLKHDGTQLHGVGILPTVPVERTISAIADGRDEQIEAALEVLNEGR